MDAHDYIKQTSRQHWAQLAPWQRACYRCEYRHLRQYDQMSALLAQSLIRRILSIEAGI